MPTTITAQDAQPLEEGVYIVTVQPKDEDGNAVTPSAMTWTLTDRKGTVINSRSDVSATPGTSVTITLKGDDLQLTETADNWRELLVKYTYDSSAGSNLPGRDVLRFEIQPLAGVS